MRQQYRYVAGPVSRQSREDVLHVGDQVVPLELSRAYQAHDGGSTLACS